MESAERLKAENDRLMAEMASMKKKIKLALKKQQADLQAKIQAAEQRAAAAEEALAGSANGSPLKVNSQIAAPQSPGSALNGDSSPRLSLGSEGVFPVHGEMPASPEINNGEISHPLSEISPDRGGAQIVVDSLRAELKSEIEAGRSRDYAAAKERQLLESEITELKKTNETIVKHKDQERIEFEEKLRLLNESFEKRVEHLTKSNEKLEVQLMAAAGQVNEAFSRMSATQDDIERLSKEGNEANRARASLASENERLASEHERLSSELENTFKELEQANNSLSEAQKMLREKTKEIEDLAAARKSAQEGQEAAVAQLMERLAEMESTGTCQQAEFLREAAEERVKRLLDEKEHLQKELERSSEAVMSLKGELNALQQRLTSLEASPVTPVDQDNSTGEQAKALDSVTISKGELALRESIAELKAENEALHLQLEVKSQGAALGSLQPDGGNLESVARDASVIIRADNVDEVAVLKERLHALQEEIKHLSKAHSEALQKIETLTKELVEAGMKLDSETKSRDDKYAELDAKFGRLQKRAKQRIQEVQKEKDEVEVQLTAAGEKAAQALSKQAAVQDELDRARLQAGEALRSLSAERQELRLTNNKLKEEIEDVRRVLEAKEHNLSESRRIASEKDQIALEMAAQLKESESIHEAALLDLKEKHQKVVDDLKAQVADGLADSTKLVETISALQAELSTKEAKLAELEAASSGEVVRLGASLEAAKGEVSRLEQEHKKEQELWQTSLEKLKKKLEDSELALRQHERDTAEMRTQLESELEKKRQALSAVQSDLAAANEQAARVANDLASYKVRAYALLQRKEAELSAAKDVELVAAQEAALKEAKRDAAAASAERDTARKALQEVVSDYETKLAARGVALLDAEQRIRDAVIKLEVAKGHLAAEQLEWQSRLEEVEASWRSRLETLEGKVKDTVEPDLRQEYTAVLNDYENLKSEFESFREMVDKMIEDKDGEISRLLEDNTALQRSLQQQQQYHQQSSIQRPEPTVQAPDASDAASMVALAEHQILVLARQQAQREDEVSQCRRHIQALQEEIAELEQENRLHSQQENLLKEEVRNLERAHKRDGVDMTYLKNIILKLIETGEVEALLPVVAMLLQFSPEELKRCHDTYNNATMSDKPLSIPAVVETPPSTPSSFFSRLTNFS
ncbi:hypothetical protein MPTK2_1g14280 [Marchantia polymorpha subsp. ruderalis]